MGPELWGIDVAQSWAELVGAVGTAAAFGVAAGVYKNQMRDRRDAEARHARLVYRDVWHGLRNVSQSGDLNDKRSDRGNQGA